jgi:hypothetical protein
MRAWHVLVCPIPNQKASLLFRLFRGIGITHGGVIYADSKRLRQSDVRGLIRRLIAFVEKHHDEDWTCREGWL